jgi:hypothetical protein
VVVAFDPLEVVNSLVVESLVVVRSLLEESLVVEVWTLIFVDLELGIGNLVVDFEQIVEKEVDLAMVCSAFFGAEILDFQMAYFVGMVNFGHYPSLVAGIVDFDYSFNYYLERFHLFIQLFNYNVIKIFIKHNYR